VQSSDGTASSTIQVTVTGVNGPETFIIDTKVFDTSKTYNLVEFNKGDSLDIPKNFTYDTTTSTSAGLDINLSQGSSDYDVILVGVTDTKAIDAAHIV
jgi:hypothetical protein